MMIIRAQSYDDMSRKAANIISAQVILHPASVLGLATGSSPLGTYRLLIDRHRKGDLDFSAVKSVNLDEYQGLAPDSPQSYRYFMRHNLFQHINIRPENTYIPNGLEADAQAECKRYDGVIDDAGGIDLQLLGIGHNGHIGFNEPGGAFEKGTHLVALSDSTIEANKRFFDSEADVPRHAYTMGIRSIMHARRIVLIASGKDKAQIIQKALRGPITPAVPASVLQLHGNFTLVADEDALFLLR